MVTMGSRSVVLWVLRLAWLLLPLVLAPALGGALDERTAPMSLVVLTGLWGCWVAGLVGVLVPSTATLTSVRVLAPLALLTALGAALAGAEQAATALAVAGTLAVGLLVFSAEVGLALVQGSAYGDERRFPLRPPGALLVGPLPLSWALMAGPTVAGALLLGARQWAAGALFALLGAVLVVLLVPRLHRLSKRFVVLVPAGFVVHDPLLLGDTAMFRTPAVAALALALTDTTAVDLTGRSLGNAVEVRLVRPGQLVPNRGMLAGSLRERQSRSVEVQSFLVAPSRPGRLLAEAAAHGYPVGWRSPDAVPPPST